MLRVAVLSGWHVHADGYAREFHERPDSTVAAVWDELPERGKAFAEKFGVDFEPDLDKILARGDVDAVSVTTPTNMHKEVLIKAARAKKHIFCEKVLAFTAADCAEIRKEIEAAGVKFCISFPFRTHPHNLLAKKVVEDGILGDITMMRVRNAHNGASRGWLPPHFYDAVQCGGGAMMDLGAHPMYLIVWLLGKPEAMSSAFTHVTGKPVEDNSVSIMKYKNGALAISETGFVSTAGPFTLELHGTEGCFLIQGNEVKLFSPKVTSDPEGYTGWVNVGRRPRPLPSPIAQFVEGILEGKEIHFGLDEAVALTEMMEAAYKSHESGMMVKV